MKLISISIIALAAMTAPSFANEAADQCRAYVAENGGDDSGCDCIGATADADADFAAAIASIEGPDDLDAADASTKEKIAACFPDSSVAD